MRLQRSLEMTPVELGWRTRDAAHKAAERLRWHLRSATWRRDRVRCALTPTAVDATTRRALERGDWQQAHDAIADRILGRPARFVLDPATADALVRRITVRWPGAAADAAARADRILNGRYDLLGYRGVHCARRDTHIDWHADPVHGRRAPERFYSDVPFLNPEIGDHKIIWELNRHQHWLQLGRAAWLTGETHYAHEIIRQFDSWLEQNPPLTGINWASMLEIGLRAISWTWALHALLAIREPVGSAWLVDFAVALDRSLTHVERHLSYYFSPNTHLTGEALALYVVGTALPELAGSGRWADTGRRVLLDEIERQILSDGGHVERSTHYQRYTLDFYLLATLTARSAGDDLAAQRFADASDRLATFTRTIAADDGQLPRLGDDDGGMLWPLTGRPCGDVRDSLSVAAAVLGRADLAPWGTCEEVLWIAGPDAGVPPGAAAPLATRLLSPTGYFVARDDSGSHAVFDVGPHGYMNGGHAHADALALTLVVEGRPLLIDPGTSTYTMRPELRDRMRSSMSHNTITVDDRSQSVPGGPFHWQSAAHARVLAARQNPAFDWIEAAHDGYEGLVHRRTVIRSADAGWLIADVIEGHGRHVAAAHWHFDPAWYLIAEGGRVRATHQDGPSVWLLHDEAFHAEVLLGDEATGLGWCAPAYGVLVPTSAVRIRTESFTPIVLVTWIGSAAAFAAPTLRVAEASQNAVIVEIRDARRAAVFMMRRAGESEAPPIQAGEYETDALLLHYVTEDGCLQSLSIAEGQWCRTRRAAWPSVRAAERIHDLHIAACGNEWELQSLQPPCQVALEGMSVSTGRASGGGLPLSSNPATDRLLIHESDWPRNLSKIRRLRVPLNSGAAFARH